MGVPTVAESQLQRPSGSGVATATGYRTQVRPAKTAETPPPLYLVPLELALEGQRRVRGVVRVFLAPESAPNPPPTLVFEYSL